MGKGLTAFMVLFFVGFVGFIGFMGGIATERGYQCDKVGGQMIGNSTCIRGAEVVLRWAG